MERVGKVLHTKLARFTKDVETLAQEAVVGNVKPTVQRGNGGYADWVVVSIHGLKTYLDLPYRRILKVLHEMPRIERILALERPQLLDFITMCSYAGAENGTLAQFLRLSAELHGTGKIQAIDATGIDRVVASQHYAKWTSYTFREVITTALIDCKTVTI